MPSIPSPYSPREKDLMTTSSLRAPGGPAKRLAATLYAYTFLDEFVLLYPFYTLLFVDTGLSTAEISSLLAIWSLTSVVMEVPSGVWADTVSRRALLALAPLLAAIGFGLLVAFPSYGVFAVGFVLWGTSGALQSGAASGVAVGFVAVAAAFCAFQMAAVLADARLQESIMGPARATVTSLAGLGTEVGALLVYGGYAAASALTDHATIFTVSALPYAVLALVLFLGGSRGRPIRT